ncbi:potassium channel family protein [Marinobacter sp. GN3S48]|uniref:potassium channel family protein n=1 Tax=Marinobacter sp. GN3S48 TaxID=3382302 RepID=UPI00387ABC89
MNTQLLVVPGIIVLVIVMVDVAWTTLTTQGSGPITRLITIAVEWASAKAHAVFGNRAVLVAAGPIAIVAVGSAWLLSLWAGWLLIFSAFPDGVIEAQSEQTAGLVDRIYFVGFTLSTLGMGDFKPGGDVTRLLTALAAFNGLVLVTLIITYAVPLVQGAVARRKLAFSISLLGSSPQEMVWRAWQNKNTQGFENALGQVSSDLIQCSEQRLAYPLLDLFHCKQSRFSLGVQLGRLDDALSLLTEGLQPNYRWNSFTVGNIREVVSHYLNRFEKRSNNGHLDMPPLPAIGLLKSKNVPLADNQDDAFDHLKNRRVRLHRLVRREGWKWSAVEAEDQADELSP